MATEFLDPPTWTLPDQAPLNTRPDDPEKGVFYKTNWYPIQPFREITAESNSVGQAGFTVRFKDRANFERDCLGVTSYTPGNTYLSRILPILHGGLQDDTLFCRMLREEKFYDPTSEGKKVMDEDDGPNVVGWGAMAAVLYRGFFVQANYDFLKDADVEDKPVPELKRYLTRFFTDEIYHRRVASWQFVYADQPDKPAPVLGSLPEHVQRWTYTSLRWPWANDGTTPVPIGVIAETGGRVNDNIFDPDVVLQLTSGTVLNGFPAEQLLYESYQLIGPYRGADSKLYVDYVNNFLWNPKGWNKVYKPGAGTGPADPAAYVNVHENNFPTRPAFAKVDFNKLYLPRG